MKRTTSTWEHNGYTLRPARKEDAENYYRAGFERLDPELARLTGSKERYSRDEVISFFLACLDDPDRREAGVRDCLRRRMQPVDPGNAGRGRQAYDGSGLSPGPSH